MNYINPIIKELLIKRGISDELQMQEFLAAKPKKTYDPFLLLNLEAGVDLILKAIEDKKQICIYGDYDADGITSVSILMEFLGTLTDHLEYYIPSRFDEGYGLNKEAIRMIRERGVDVLITVDCGSVSYEEVELAKELGMDVVVTDHHSITDVKADCLLINTKQRECPYPFKGMAGCGVAFKLAQAIQKKAGLPKPVLNRSLDLVAIGTIADIVPLLDENRTLVKFGMNIINSGARPGLKALIEGISLKPGSIRSDQVAFGIAPHLNAAGRMGDAKVAVELLLAKDPAFIQKKVAELIHFNQERKSIQEKAFERCIEIIDEKYAGRNFLLVHAEGIHEGIAGIVAGKLKDRYERPAILVTPSGEELKGTGRSIPGVDLYKTLKAHEELFIRFGGHEGACGFLMRREAFEQLSDALESDMKRMLSENSDLLQQTISPDLHLDGSDVTLKFSQDLEQLAPFGSQNPKPLFLLKQVNITRQYPMGSSGTHIRFQAVCQGSASVECVLFNKAKEYEDLLYGREPVNLIGTVDFQEWRGNKKVQFTVEVIERDK